MSVKIKLIGSLQSLAGDRETVEVEGKTLGQCLDSFVNLFPEARKYIFGNSGSLSALVIVKGEDVPIQDVLRPVSDNDELLLVDLVGGG